MLSKLYAIPRRVRLLVILIIVVAFVYFVARFFFAESRNVPGDFLEAREQASMIAQEIVNISSQTSSHLNEAAALDSEKKYTEALILVSEELERNRLAREKAVNLAVKLEIMAKNLSQISPPAKSQKALEALSSETALISRLITYNDYLNQLLEILRSKFLDKADGDSIPDMLAKINNESQAINDLNKKFNDTMKEFDAE